jgi:hypothetical protein
MNINIQYIVVAIYQAYRFLNFTFNIDFFKSAKTPYAMINVYNIISRFKILYFVERDGCFA